MVKQILDWVDRNNQFGGLDENNLIEFNNPES